MTSIRRVAVLGAGTMGSRIAAHLANAGRDVTFLVRARRQAQLEKTGLNVRSGFAVGWGQCFLVIVFKCQIGNGLHLSDRRAAHQSLRNERCDQGGAKRRAGVYQN